MNHIATCKLFVVVFAWLQLCIHIGATYDLPVKDIPRGRVGSLREESISLASSLLQRQVPPNAPHAQGYIPQANPCPMGRPFIRNGSRLSANETSWLKVRRNVTMNAMIEFLGRFDFNSFNASSYIERHAFNSSLLPNIGIAVSGGGYRALMNGGGALQAFDSRTANASVRGHLGGVLQSATYLTGLSGGSWLVGSIYLNNFTDVTSLRDSETVWLFQDSILTGPTQSTEFAVRTPEYYSQIQNAVNGKLEAGYNTSITDYWGRSIAYQLINATEGGVGYTWSSIALDINFQSADMPMPIIIADGRAPGQILIPKNTTVFEFNPWEFGTFNPPLKAFVPLEFLASSFSAGILPTNQDCVRGFDNAGFLMGTSSSLFNQAFLTVNGTDVPQVLKSSINRILSSVGEANNDIAVYEPNPFYLYTNQSEYASSTLLTLVDGGEDLQNIPLEPLLLSQRGVDVILAIDSSADTNTRWPNGTAMVATYERSMSSLGQSSGLAFPYVPDQNTFINLGLNNRPTFFGCNSSNVTGSAPLVVYIPNAPYIYLSNVSTFDLQYNTTERDAIIENGYDIATLGNGTVDSDWPTCLGCAILSRSLERTNTAVPASCIACFQRYCWDGTTNSSEPGNYYPAYKLSQLDVSSNGGGRVVHTFG